MSSRGRHDDEEATLKSVLVTRSVYTRNLAHYQEPGHTCDPEHAGSEAYPAHRELWYIRGSRQFTRDPGFTVRPGIRVCYRHHSVLSCPIDGQTSTGKRCKILLSNKFCEVVPSIDLLVVRAGKLQFCIKIMIQTVF